MVNEERALEILMDCVVLTGEAISWSKSESWGNVYGLAETLEEQAATLRQVINEGVNS